MMGWFLHAWNAIEGFAHLVGNKTEQMGAHKDVALGVHK